MSEPFEIRAVVPIDRTRAFLSTDVAWNCFVLADLAPPYGEHARLPVALARDGQIVASCLLYDYPGDRSLVPFGSAEGIRAILASVELPDQTFVVAREPDWPVVSEFFEPIGEFRTMHRMRLKQKQFAPAVLDSTFMMQRVEIGQYDDINSLYESWSGITTDLFPHGQVFGVRDAVGQLGAVAVATASDGLDRIGTIGGVFTHPELRGRGLGKAITTRACQHWFDLGRDEIYLNVNAENLAARSAYRALGFTDRLQYRALPARRRS